MISMNIFEIYPSLSKIDNLIDEIEVYMINVKFVRHLSHSTWSNRQHCILKIGSGNKYGWSEEIISVNNPNVDLKEWVSCFSELKGLSISDAFQYLREDNGWERVKTEMAEMVLIDLAGKLLDKNALDLLELSGEGPVPGLFCILQDDPEEVEKYAKKVLDERLTYLKVKLFGKNELDKEIVKTARKVIGSERFLIGDVNRGYRKNNSQITLEEIANKLNKLHRCGLDACEDPAQLSNEEWVELQKTVNPLELVPDYPMRPALKAYQKFNPEMGEIFNIHPRCTGSILDAVCLGKKVKDSGRKLMIGDNSLIGPSCSNWQQLAVGLEAEWVEALEKPDESDVFLKCIIDKTTKMSNGKIEVSRKSPGFGIRVDDGLLKKSADDYLFL